MYRPGTQEGKPDALSRRPEYRPEKGARHDEQKILKPEHFHISLIHRKRSSRKALEPQEHEPTTLRMRKLAGKGRIPTKGSRFTAGHDIYALKDG